MKLTKSKKVTLEVDAGEWFSIIVAVGEHMRALKSAGAVGDVYQDLAKVKNLNRKTEWSELDGGIR